MPHSTTDSIHLAGYMLINGSFCFVSRHLQMGMAIHSQNCDEGKLGPKGAITWRVNKSGSFYRLSVLEWFCKTFCQDHFQAQIFKMLFSRQVSTAGKLQLHRKITFQVQISLTSKLLGTRDARLRQKRVPSQRPIKPKIFREWIFLNGLQESVLLFLKLF